MAVAPDWYLVTTNYWGSGGPGANGITAGPLTAPGMAAATSPGPEHLQPRLVGLPAELRQRRQRRELTGSMRK